MKGPPRSVAALSVAAGAFDLGADVTARYPGGRSLRQVARDKGFQEIARLLQ